MVWHSWSRIVGDRCKMGIAFVVIVVLIILAFALMPWILTNPYLALSIVALVIIIAWFVGWRIFRPSY